ncbi:MAG: RluA family pseudouridine synthase [Elusimicrobiota bacterium]
MCKKQGTLKVDTTRRIRLDKYLAGELAISRTKIQKLIEEKKVTVDGKYKDSHFPLKGGEKIVYEPYKEEKSGSGDSEVKPENIPLDIVHEEENFLILNKPADLVVHPAPKNRTGTLLNGLMSKYKNPQLVHRLDKDTSGVMVVALNDEAALNLRKQFKDRKVKKVYIALLNGRLEQRAGEIKAPIRRSRRDRTKMEVSWHGAKKSITRYKVIEKRNNISLIEIYPLSGRTHQIRVHFSYLGFPVLGDKKYGKITGGAARQMLHAWQISFNHPVKNKRTSFKINPPEDFSSILEVNKFKKFDK